jgi:hypothetical protein
MFNIWTEKPKKQSPDVTLALRPGSGEAYEVTIYCVDPRDGKDLICGNLVTLSPEGVYLHAGINPSLGFDLTTSGVLMRSYSKD